MSLINQTWRRVQEVARLSPVRSLLLRRAALMSGTVALTRILGFGFSVVSARALTPADFGVVTFTLALANLASILLFNSPAGLSRALARSHRDPHQQNVIFSNYLVIVGCLLAASLLAAVPIGRAARLEGLVLVGLLANLLGTATLETYLELQRGRERFLTVAAFNVLSNLIQLLAVAGFFVIGWAQPGPYVIAFGLSSVLAATVVQLFSPLGVRFLRASVDWARIREGLRFVLPLVFDTACFMVWSGVDVLLLRALTTLDVVGRYGAAKSLSNGALVAGTAIGTALVPQAARLLPAERSSYFRTLLLMVVGATVPAVIAIAVLAPWLLTLFFGPGYCAAATTLIILAGSMGMYGIGLTLEASWIAMGRPRVAAAGTAVAAVLAVVTAPILIGLVGMAGAALASALGSAGRLVLLGVVTARSMRAGPSEAP